MSGRSMMLQYNLWTRHTFFALATLIWTSIAFHASSLGFNLASPKLPQSRRSFLRKGGALAIGLLGACPSSSAKNLPDIATADFSKTGTVEALVPIVQLLSSLRNIQSDLQDASSNVLSKALVLDNVPAEEQSFKRLFDAYSDPVSYKQKFLDQNAFLVYYSRGFDGPGRPSIESNLPTKQSVQYGCRNEAWIAWEEFLAELSFARRHPSDEEDPDDLLQPLAKAIAAVETYLEQAPVADVQESWKRSRCDAASS